MHLGFNSMNTVDDPEPAELARRLEDAGFESLWYGEHNQIPMSRKTPYPGGVELPEPYKKMMDPYISLAMAAAATTTLKLGTGIALPMERELFSLAKMMVTLDRLSGGRHLMGAGVGWNEEQFNLATHHPWDKRFAVLRETVEALRVLCSEPEPEYHGSYVDFEKVWFEPKPLSGACPPVILGVMGPLGIKHAARWADGWMPVDIALPEPAVQIAQFREQVAAHGRDPDSVEITLVVMDDPNADKLKRLRDAGVHRVLVGVGVENWDRPDIVLPMIDEFGKLIPELAA